jgi:peptidoglycan/xylan/chitin deacetylase (PgdA/CDA1 family)
VHARAALKEAVYGAAYLAGLPHFTRRKLSGGLIVLTYHSFGPAEEHPYVGRQPIDRLEAQLEHLQRYYEIVPLEQGIERTARGPFSGNSRPMVAITVDDGYGDNYSVLFPVLCRMNVPATIFLATDYLDSERLPWPTRVSALLHYAQEKEIDVPVVIRTGTAAAKIESGHRLRYHLSHLGHAERDGILADLERRLSPRPYRALAPLTWDQVRRMQDQNINFGSHTQFHGWLDRLDANEVRQELDVSKQRVEAETGRPCSIIAYPNGNWSDVVAKIAADAGYQYALTQERGVNRAASLRPRALHRIEVPYNEMIGSFACRVGGLAL